MGLFSILMNNRGEAGAGSGSGAAGGDGGDKGAAGGEKAFTQADVDRVVQERLSRERNKYGDYDDLKKFKDEHAKNEDAQKQKELEAQKNYEELKKSWAEKESNYTKALAEKDNAFKALKIDNALGAEVAAQNAYPEAKEVLKSLVSLSDDGTPHMKGKDQVGNEVAVTLTEGVKKFLAERPHLVKASQSAGGNTAAGGAGAAGAGAGGSDELADLNAKYMQAISQRNVKLAGELKAKIQGYFTQKNISRTV